MEPEDCAGHVPRQPADQGQQASEYDIDGVVSGHGGGQALLGEFAFAGAGDPDDGQGAESAEDMDRGRAAAVEKARAQVEVETQLGQPAAGPDPVRGEREDDGGHHGGGRAAGQDSPAVHSGAPGQERGQGHGQEFKQQSQLRVRRSRAHAAEQEGCRTQPVPALAGQPKAVTRAAGGSGRVAGEGRAHHGKDDDRNGHDDEAAE